MSASLLTPEALAIVGQATAPRRGLITAKDIRKFCAAIDEPNPLYSDRDAARAAGYPDVITPPLFKAAATRPVPMRAGLLADGQYDNLAPPGLGHLQTMLAGQSWEIERPAVAGEEIIEIVTTKSITERRGSTGSIVFVEQEATLTTPAGELLERYTNMLILRAPPPPRAPHDPAGMPMLAAHERPMTVITDDGLVKHTDMISLFMFSAATWAVHRIHWDVPYSQREGLPLPILPGWMLSSFLAQLAEMRAPAGHRLKRIGVRYWGVVHPGDALSCTARHDASSAGLLLSMTTDRGQEVATGQAEYAA